MAVALIVLGATRSDPTHRIVFLFFGFVLAFLVLASDLAAKSTAWVRGRKKRCPICAENVHRDALVCRFCSHQFREDRAERTRPQ